MSNSQHLEGVYTAIVTPFDDNGNIDYESLENLLKTQINKVNGVVVVGTTGEASTLTFKEHKEIIRFVYENFKDYFTIIAGTGANSTKEALELTEYAAKLGVNYSLQVVPYYIKPSQKGLYRHFSTLAKEFPEMDFLIYNIPSRTCVEIEIDTIKELKENYNNIVGVKECGKLERVKYLEKIKDFAILSGNDDQTLNMMKLSNKVKGVISVVSNLLPKETKELVYKALNKSWKEAEEINNYLKELNKALFIETNPVPVKYALYKTGVIKSPYVRSPLAELEDKNKELLDKVLEKYNLIKI